MRGGKRKGAGRKAGSKKTDNRKKISITLPTRWVEWLRGRDLSQSKTVEKALICYNIDRTPICMTDDELEIAHNGLVDELENRGLL